MDNVIGNSPETNPNVEKIDYKGHSFKVNMELMDIPNLKEIKCFTNGGYYLTNKKDVWLAELLELYYTSNLHGSIINDLHLQITKEIDDEVFNRITLDYLIFGGFYLEIFWNYFHDKIVKINHVDFTKIRVGLIDKETHRPEYVIHSNDFFKFNYRKWTKLEMFNTEKHSADHQIYYFRRYSPSSDIYPKPYYNSVLKYVYVQNELSTYFANLVRNNFVANGILHLPNPMSEEQMLEQERMFLRDTTGSKNAGSIIVTTGTKEEAPEFIKFNQDADDGKYSFLPDYTDQQIARGHGVPIPLLFETQGKLGGTDEVKFYDDRYKLNVVEPFKRDIMNAYMQIKNLMLPEPVVVTPTPLTHPIEEKGVVKVTEMTPKTEEKH